MGKKNFCDIVRRTLPIPELSNETLINRLNAFTQVCDINIGNAKISSSTNIGSVSSVLYVFPTNSNYTPDSINFKVERGKDDSDIVSLEGNKQNLSIKYQDKYKPSFLKKRGHRYMPSNIELGWKIGSLSLNFSICSHYKNRVVLTMKVEDKGVRGNLPCTHRLSGSYDDDGILALVKKFITTPFVFYEELENCITKSMITLNAEQMDKLVKGVDIKEPNVGFVKKIEKRLFSRPRKQQ